MLNRSQQLMQLFIARDTQLGRYNYRPEYTSRTGAWAVKDCATGAEVHRCSSLDELDQFIAGLEARPPQPTIETLTTVTIARVYTGKPDRCMCGCAGTYSEAPARKTTVLKKVRQFAAEGGLVENLDNRIFTAVIGKTQYTLYTK
jgi:hypothetical protein